MKANELRIGNYVDTVNRSGEVHIPRNKPMKIGCIEFFKVELYEVQGPFSRQFKPKKTNIPDLCGIPLTKEWLLKFGFIDSDYPDALVLEVLSRGVLNAYNISGDIRIEIGTSSGYIFGDSPIKHVHQLQNLYFALTGEELEIKNDEQTTNK